MAVEQGGPQDVSLREYARVVWRRKWVVVAVTVVMLVLALANSYRKTPLYAASATLIYEPSVDVTDPLSGSGYYSTSQRESELNAVGSIIASPELVEAARQGMSSDTKKSGYTVSASSSSSSGQSSDSTVAIKAVSASPKAAAEASNAYADAFVAYRKSSSRSRCDRPRK